MSEALLSYMYMLMSSGGKLIYPSNALDVVNLVSIRTGCDCFGWLSTISATLLVLLA